MSVFISLCFCLSHSLPVSQCASAPLSLSLSISVSLCLCLCVFLCLDYEWFCVRYMSRLGCLFVSVSVICSLARTSCLVKFTLNLNYNPCKNKVLEFEFLFLSPHSLCARVSLYPSFSLSLSLSLSLSPPPPPRQRIHYVSLLQSLSH